MLWTALEIAIVSCLELVFACLNICQVLKILSIPLVSFLQLTTGVSRKQLSVSNV